MGDQTIPMTNGNTGSRKESYKLKKLVTYCTVSPNENDGVYSYEGKSRAEMSKVNFAMPASKENFAFWEEFRNAEDRHPFRLSFTYLGADGVGQVAFNFQHYENVSTVELSGKFKNVNTVFQIVGKLPNCGNVRFYLSKDNIMVGPNEMSIMENLKGPLNQQHPYTSSSVTLLRIEQLGKIPDSVWIESSRLNIILRYALMFLPSLKLLAVNDVDATAQNIDAIYQFYDEKGFSRRPIAVKNHKISCPEFNASAIGFPPPPPSTIRAQNEPVPSGSSMLYRRRENMSSSRPAKKIKQEPGTSNVEPRRCNPVNPAAAAHAIPNDIVANYRTIIDPVSAPSSVSQGNEEEDGSANTPRVYYAELKDEYERP